jgi:monoamine oxidase
MRAIDQHRDPHPVADRHNVHDGQNEEIGLLSAARERVAAAADIGLGNVVKILFRFATKWWADHGARDLSDLSFLLSDATVPTWWTQYPDGYPVLMGWLAGPKADRVSSLAETELIDRGSPRSARFSIYLRTASGGISSRRERSTGATIRSRAALISTRRQEHAKAQSVPRKPNGDIFLFWRGALCRFGYGHGEAALASGRETAQTIMIGYPTVPSRVL